ncbi:MAG: NADH:ubiquinone reductase (Na(+)-transporting) subunit C [Gammaproteobacteria bacterium]|nr:NADH:ubiquinone reductase (Na(+)-transporting) subunit C [Gammaproteobacteria bacterium]
MARPPTSAAAASRSSSPVRGPGGEPADRRVHGCGGAGRPTSRLRAARDPDISRQLSDAEDIATIKRLERYGLVYLKKNPAGEIETAVIPIRGYGLWGTLYGFLALEDDFETVAGIGFYEHKETPGLGGEIENPSWKAIWEGKELYDESGEPAIDLTKSMAPPGSDAREHQIDMLSGATMTSRGVENLVNFWVGGMGYGPYLKSMKQEKA